MLDAQNILITDFDKTLTTSKVHETTARKITGKNLETKHCWVKNGYYFLPRSWEEYFSLAGSVKLKSGILQLFYTVHARQGIVCINSAGMFERLSYVLKKHQLTDTDLVDFQCAQSFAFVGLQSINAQLLSPHMTGTQTRGKWIPQQGIINDITAHTQYKITPPSGLPHETRSEIKLLLLQTFLQEHINAQYVKSIAYMGDGVSDYDSVIFLSQWIKNKHIMLYLFPVEKSPLHLHVKKYIHDNRWVKIIPWSNIDTVQKTLTKAWR